MNRLMIVMLSAVAMVAVSGSVFGQSKPQPQPKPPAPPPFIEASVPDGKALVYVYTTDGRRLRDSVGLLLLAKTGPIGVLDFSYLSYFADPGIVKLWLVASATQEFKFEASAGQIYYVKSSFGGLELIPKEKAKKEIERLWPSPE